MYRNFPSGRSESVRTCIRKHDWNLDSPTINSKDTGKAAVRTIETMFCMSIWVLQRRFSWVGNSLQSFLNPVNGQSCVSFTEIHDIIFCGIYITIKKLRILTAKLSVFIISDHPLQSSNMCCVNWNEKSKHLLYCKRIEKKIYSTLI